MPQVALGTTVSLPSDRFNAQDSCPQKVVQQSLGRPVAVGVSEEALNRADNDHTVRSSPQYIAYCYFVQYLKSPRSFANKTTAISGGDTNPRMTLSGSSLH